MVLGLVQKGFWVLRNRPMEFMGSLRGFLLFQATRALQPLFYGDEIRLGINVRVQRLSCLRAEKPGARVSVGDHSVVYENALVEAYGTGLIEIGESSVIGDVRICARERIRIGKRLVSSWNVFIQDFDPHPIEPELRGIQVHNICANFRPSFDLPLEPKTLPWDFPRSAIEIGDDVWIGANVTILKGARIGNGCIIATGAVVTAGEYPDCSIIAGSPARVVKSIGAKS